MAVTRRNLLRSGWRLGGGLLGLIAGWTSWELLRPLAVAGASGKIKLGSPANFKAGTRIGRMFTRKSNITL